MKLYQVKDADVELWIMAPDITTALTAWQERLAYLDGGPVEAVPLPTSIIEIADEDDVVLPYDHDDVVNNLRIELGHAKTERNNRTADYQRAEKAYGRARELIEWTREAAGMKGEDDFKEAITIMAQQVQDYERHLKALAGKKD